MSENHPVERRAMTRVRIGFFLPVGLEETWYVNTKDRGLAVRTVMACYSREQLAWLTDIYSMPSGGPARESRDSAVIEPDNENG